MSNKGAAREGPYAHTNEGHGGKEMPSRPGKGSGIGGNVGSKSAFPIRHETRVGENLVRRDNRGKLRDVEGRGMHIHHDMRGERYFVSEHNGRRIVGLDRRRGYMERPYLRRNGRVYVQRTYVVGGVRYANVYRSYSYRGAAYYYYVPGYYYHPAFYGWAYNPWAAPVSYRWGWYGDPWYSAYGSYFTPYSVYPSASLWLTDYMLAENLRLAYEARDSAPAADASQPSDAATSSGSVHLSPEVKEMIAQEVKRQLAAEQSTAAHAAQETQSAPNLAASSAAEQAPPALDSEQRVFVVASNLDLTAESGECAVTPGDIILRTGTTANENNKVGVNVVSSKQGDCPVNTVSEVEVSDLQEMHNHFREQMDSGLKTLAATQGKNGLPAAPDTSTSTGQVPPAQPDAGVETELQNQQKDADHIEQQVEKSQASPGTL